MTKLVAPFDTKGRRKLEKAMADRQISQSALGREFGISQAAVRQWVIGMARPSEPMRALLEAYLGIPVPDWVTPAERRAQKAALRRLGKAERRPPRAGEPASHRA